MGDPRRRPLLPVMPGLNPDPSLNSLPQPRSISSVSTGSAVVAWPHTPGGAAGAVAVVGRPPFPLSFP